MDTISQNDERNLLSEVADGNIGAFDTLYDRYSKKVYTFALRILRSKTCAEDVTQETFLKLWQMSTKAREISNLSSYLRSTARNISLNILRRQEIEKRAESRLSHGWQEDELVTEEHVLFQEAKRILEEAILLLPPKQQQAFRLCYQKGFTYEEAATKMLISPRTIAVHMKLALRFVRNYVRKATHLLALLTILMFF